MKAQRGGNQGTPCAMEHNWGPRAAFTLVEVLVVIAIISVLVTIVASAGMSLSTSARERDAQRTLQILDAAMDEWERAADRSLTWWEIHDPQDEWPRAEMHSNTPEVFIISEMLEVIARSQEVQPILAQIDDDAWYTYEGGRYPAWVDTGPERAEQDQRFVGARTVLDPWDTPIYATHPGRLWRESDGVLYGLQRDPDQTIRTYNEHKYGVAPNRSIVFVSAGPDRLFGIEEEFLSSMQDREKAKHKARRDNIFSMPVTFENP